VNSLRNILVIFLLTLALLDLRVGRGEVDAVLRGRDLVLVVDVSKSMQADDMDGATGVHSRFESARYAVQQFLEQLKQQPGQRVGLVVFAGKPFILSPLTADFNLLLQRTVDIDAVAPPTEVISNEDDAWRSGTRFGQAIATAVSLFESEFTGYQDVILLSDGDDPLEGDDRLIGIRAAKNANVPIHVIEIGDDVHATPIGAGDVVSKLEPELLRDLARSTGGEIIIPGRKIPELMTFWTKSILPLPKREIEESLLAERKPIFVWFLLPACFLLIWEWRIR
jgi:Ca-activated chloride channel homolog